MTFGRSFMGMRRSAMCRCTVSHRSHAIVLGARVQSCRLHEHDGQPQCVHDRQDAVQQGALHPCQKWCVSPRSASGASAAAIGVEQVDRGAGAVAAKLKSAPDHPIGNQSDVHTHHQSLMGVAVCARFCIA